MINDIHSIAQNLSAAALAEIASHLRLIGGALVALVIISLARFVVELTRASIELRQWQQVPESECYQDSSPFSSGL